MAIIDSKGYVRGAVGPSVFRRAWGKSIVQAKPHKCKQTAPTIESSSEFGLISSTGAAIRHAFAPVGGYCDGAVVGRMVSAVSRSVRDAAGTVRGQRDLHDGELSPLVGLEFNLRSRIQDVLRLRPEVARNAAGQVQVQLPELQMSRDLRLPDKLRHQSYRMQIRFLLIAFNFRENYYEYVDRRDLEYRRRQPSGPQTIVFDGEVPAGSMLMLSMSVMLYSSNALDGADVLLNSPEFSPCALIGAWQSEKQVVKSGANPAKTEKEGRFMMNYTGNEILAALAGRVRKKAKSTVKPPSSGHRTGSPPDGKNCAEKDDPLIIKGRRISF